MIEVKHMSHNLGSRNVIFEAFGQKSGIPFKTEISSITHQKVKMIRVKSTLSLRGGGGFKKILQKDKMGNYLKSHLKKMSKSE